MGPKQRILNGDSCAFNRERHLFNYNPTERKMKMKMTFALGIMLTVLLAIVQHQTARAASVGGTYITLQIPYWDEVKKMADIRRSIQDTFKEIKHLLKDQDEKTEDMVF